MDPSNGRGSSLVKPRLSWIFGPDGPVNPTKNSPRLENLYRNTHLAQGRGLDMGCRAIMISTHRTRVLTISV